MYSLHQAARPGVLMARPQADCNAAHQKESVYEATLLDKLLKLGQDSSCASLRKPGRDKTSPRLQHTHSLYLWSFRRTSCCALLTTVELALIARGRAVVAADHFMECDGDLVDPISALVDGKRVAFRIPVFARLAITDVNSICTAPSFDGTTRRIGHRYRNRARSDEPNKSIVAAAIFKRNGRFPLVSAAAVFSGSSLFI